MADFPSIAAALRHWATERPDSPGVGVVGRTRLSFAEWDLRSRRVAAGLERAGVARGDVVGFLGKDAVLWAEVLAGASYVRAAGAPLNWRLSRTEMTAVAADAELSAVVVEAEFMPLLGHAVPSDGLPRVVLAGQQPVGYAEWLDRSGSRSADPSPHPDDVAIVVYTSGTSGRPKGVELPNRALAANLGSPAPWRIASGDVVLVPAPLFHVSGTGWLFYCLGLGAGSLYLLDIRPDVVLEILGDGEVDHALTVPAIVQMLVQHPGARSRSYPRLRTLIYGGSPMSPTVAQDAQDIFGCDLVQSYGMTETCGPITFLAPEDHRAGGRLLASAGRPVPGVDVAVFEPVSGVRCAPGETGEVWTRSDLIMSGYRNQPGELAAVLTPEGWFRTGDAGYLDEDGYLFLCDRVKDMIVSGGENIYPVEVENVLMAHPGVRDAAVIGVPHEKWGETVKAIVVSRDGQLDADELVEHCRQRLAHYKCPTSVDVVDELPRNPSGKLLKRELREPYWAGRDRVIA